MKLEIVKETKINGEVIYSIEQDGVYIRDTVNRDLSKVEEMYNRMLQIGNTDGLIREIIKTTEL